MIRPVHFVLAAAVLALSACGTYSTGSVKPTASGTATKSTAAKSKDSKLAATDPAKVLVTDADITDKPYTSLGDITVTVRKVTIFDSDPTPEKVNEALREKAAAMGADAVVLVRHGTVGVSLLSWGEMEGSGRAVKFNP